MYQQPGIILLREGTDTSQGKAQLVSNINACQAVMDTVRTTLGPRGMDKLMFDGKKVTMLVSSPELPRKAAQAFNNDPKRTMAALRKGPHEGGPEFLDRAYTCAHRRRDGATRAHRRPARAHPAAQPARRPTTRTLTPL